MTPNFPAHTETNNQDQVYVSSNFLKFQEQIQTLHTH